MVTRRGSRRVAGPLAFLVVLFLACLARADDGVVAEPARLAEAKDLFRQGVVLLDNGDTERALDFFLRSRALVPSRKNTTDAAICFHTLGRYDEALELYEEVVTRFGAELDAEDRALLGPGMAALRTRVGSLQISANVEGNVLVDGRARGKLPLLNPIRVLAGSHSLRILKDGYKPYEGRFEARPGSLTDIDARLDPLAGMGMLRIEDRSLADASAFVDGQEIGKVPWEGTLATGRHVVWTQKGERGSGPTSVTVLLGQTSLARLSSKALGPGLRLTVIPSTALLSIDGIVVGAGGWQGRLPTGQHEITVSEAGYRPQSSPIVVEPGDVPMARAFHLAVDPDDPRWPRRLPGHFALAVFGSLALTGGIGSSAGEMASALFDGPYAGGRVGFRFPPGFAPELSVGYLRLKSKFGRQVEDSFQPKKQKMPVAVLYELKDDALLQGPFVSGGGSFDVRLRHFDVFTRGAVGVLFPRAEDFVSGRAHTGGEAAPIVTHNDRRTVVPARPPLFVLGEVGAALPYGRVEFGFSVAVAAFAALGPTFGSTSGPEAISHEIGVKDHDCSHSKPTEVECVPNSAVLSGERAYGSFFLWLPQLSVTVLL